MCNQTLTEITVLSVTQHLAYVRIGTSFEYSMRLLILYYDEKHDCILKPTPLKALSFDSSTFPIIKMVYHAGQTAKSHCPTQYLNEDRY